MGNPKAGHDYVHYEESGKSFTHDNRGLREWENIMRELKKDERFEPI